MRGLMVFLVLAALTAGTGGFLYYSQKAVEAEVLAAIESADVEALAARVDFAALRDFLKEDLKRQKNDKSPVGSLYAATGPAMDKIDAVVDYYVLPENIAILYALRESAAAEVPVSSFIVGRGYQPLYGFSMTLGAPPEMLRDSPARSIAERYKVKLVFRLSGLKWKVTEMHVPLFMVPEFTYSQPAIDIYAPRR